MRLILDAHLDLSWNAMSYDRDQLRSVRELRAAEAGMTGKSRGNCTVSLPEMRRGGVAVCLATLLCRARPESLPEMDGNLGSTGERRRGEVILREDLDYANQSIACAAAQGQLAYYRLLETQGHIRMIRDAAALDAVWRQWEQGGDEHGAPIGCILSMEGADPIVEPKQAAWWWEQGLRTACLAHYGPSAYAMGTGGDGPLTPLGRELLKEFERLGVILDLVHTADTALAQALEIFSGPVFISHGNCRALVPHDRQISDEQIRQVAARGGVIGAVLDAWMLAPDYLRDDRDRPTTTLAHVADHIDYVCQLAGNARHAAIGSDLDGGFGTEQSPADLDTIADLQKLQGILASRGYSDADIDGIFHGNWLRFFRAALPR
jgi:membrane dipeptidase